MLCRTNGKDVARLGLAISKKHCALASGRNRIKRITRESFRQHQEMLAGLDIVVMNNPATARAGNEQLFNSLEQHWERCRQEIKK